MPQRITFGSLVEQLLGMFNVERGLLPTFRDLTVRPATMLRGYLSGETRKQYSNVIGFAVLMASVSSALVVLFPQPVEVFSFMREDLAASGAEQMASLFQASIVRYYQVLLYLPVPGMAIATRLLFPSWGYNYLEHLVIHTFAAAQMAFFGIVLYPLVLIDSPYALTINLGIMVLTVAYGCWVLLDLSAFRPAAAVRTLGAFALGGALTAILMAGVMASIVWNRLQPVWEAQTLDITWSLPETEAVYQRALDALWLPAIQMQYALLKAQTERPEEAIADARRAIEQAPASANLRHLHGLVHLFAGDRETALSSMQRAADMPGVPTGALDLSRLAATTGDLAAARRHAQAYERSGPENPTLLAVLAYCYRLAQAPEDANRVAAEVDAAGGPAVLGATAAAYYYLAVEDYGAAAEALERAAAAPASTPIALNLLYIKHNVFADPVLERPELERARERLGFRE